MSETALWVTESDVVSLMDMPAAIRALEAGLRSEASGAAANMAKTHVEWGGHSTLHAIGAAFPEDGIVGTKTWAHTPGGATPLIILYTSETGALLAIVEAFALGQLRTGAASGLATRILAADGADELAIVGTGKQALTQIAAVHAVRPLRRVRVFGRDTSRRRAFVERQPLGRAGRHGLPQQRAQLLRWDQFQTLPVGPAAQVGRPDAVGAEDRRDLGAVLRPVVEHLDHHSDGRYPPLLASPP